MFKPFSNLVKSFGKDSDRLLANRYQIVYQIGQGAMGEVYKAVDKTNGDLAVAIKFLSQAIMDEKMYRRFEREAKISALLGEQSNHIVKVRDYGSEEHQIPYYVMEYLDGDELDKLMKKKSLSVGKFLSLTRQICLGLECAHNGILVDGELAPIIHRDIKPSNIFLVKHPQIEHFVKILDFGVAQINQSDQSETQRSFMGTPEYCSPEQMAEEELKPTSDIYSLGVLMYKMLTKKPPIKAEKHSFQAWYQAHKQSIPPKLPSYLNLPNDLENIIMKCLQKSPSQRPQSMGEILKVITPLEREYNQNISSDSVKVDFGSTSTPLLSLEGVYRQSSWPNNKPQRKIVFPSLTEAKEGTFVSLWTMLETSEIQYFQPNKTFCFNHFLFKTDPHPMVLWINLIYNRQYEPKWLPCYLDFQTDIGRQIATNLVKNNLYHILLFALEKPQKYQELITGKISPDKIKQLQSFIVKTASWAGKKKPEVSKTALKKQFDSVKNKILAAIDSNK